ncbi:MAG: RNA polymerase sigma factor [Gemmatimonadaceae bacterium]
MLWSSGTQTAKAYRGDGDEDFSRDRQQIQLHEEREWLRRVRQGDREAFGLLVARHLDRALALAVRLLHHREDAEDLVQDAFLAALEHLDAFDDARPFWPWLSRILVNRGLDLAAARAVRATEPLPEELFDHHQDPAGAAERAEILTRFRHALALLPPRRKLIMQLFELDGYSVAEIATLLESSPATIRWHLFAARHQLRESLAPLRDDRR